MNYTNDQQKQKLLPGTSGLPGGWGLSEVEDLALPLPLPRPRPTPFVSSIMGCDCGNYFNYRVWKKLYYDELEIIILIVSLKV